VNLRPYQSRAIEAVVLALKASVSTLLVLPTGTGKTVVFSHLIHQTPGRVLVVAHREELIYQAAHKIEAVTGEHPDIEMAALKADASLFKKRRVVVASKDSLVAPRGEGRRFEKFKPDEFSLIIVDEAHHATAPTYRLIFDYFKAAKIFGVTATPDRADEIGLKQVFETVAFDYEIEDAIKDGWLVPIKQKSVEVQGLDYSTVRTTDGDLNATDVAAVLSKEELLHQFCDATLRECGDKRTIVFAPPGFNKDADDPFRVSERITEILNRHKPGSARLVWQKTEKADRKNTLTDFKQGGFQYLVNVGVFTEGFDEPGIECVVMVRATKSRALYAQMLGRGTRPLPGLVDGVDSKPDRIRNIVRSKKPSVLVLDFVGNSGQHKLITPADILGGRLDDRVLERAKQIVQQKGGSVQAAIDEAKHKIKEEDELAKQRAAQKRAEAKARAAYSTNEVSPFNAADLAPSRRFQSNGNTPATEKQIAFLARYGVDGRGMSKPEAGQRVGRIIDGFKRKVKS